MHTCHIYYQVAFLGLAGVVAFAPAVTRAPHWPGSFVGVHEAHEPFDTTHEPIPWSALPFIGNGITIVSTATAAAPPVTFTR